jgi:hypothetical protein
LKIGHRNSSRAKRDEATADHCVQSTTKSLGEQRELSSLRRKESKMEDKGLSKGI